MVLGDFNEVLVASKKWGGGVRSQRLMRDFQRALEECDLVDLGYRGSKFTWSNCQENEEFIKERLGRGVANNGWRNIFPAAEVFVKASINSDHASLVLCCDVTKRQGRKRPWFWYEANWALEEEGQNVILRAWQLHVPNHGSWTRLGTKLQRCK